MTLMKFVEQEGAKNVAMRVGVSEQTVYEWVSLKKAPRPGNVVKLIMVSNGLLNWEDIYLPFAQKELHGSSFVLKHGGGLSSLVNFDFKKELKSFGYTI